MQQLPQSGSARATDELLARTLDMTFDAMKRRDLEYEIRVRLSDYDDGYQGE